MRPARPPSGAFISVIVGVHGRDGARDALALGRTLASHGTSIAAAHVFFIDSAAPLWTSREEQAPQWERALARLRTALGVGPEAEMLGVSATSIGEGLHDLAVEQEADLIVVGACERGGLKRLAIGDDTRSVLIQAPVPVAVAPAGYARHPGPVRVIGVVGDGHPESDQPWPSPSASPLRLVPTSPASVR
ncbi:MAG TPA: universal stress protein [Solirubrobacteraceae bacterium]|nr:universal stress protein [Solirubrobacteraceae bacterium]